MSCQDFENIVAELARGQMMDLAHRDRALGHAGNCLSCAARLARERELDAGLHALAACDEEKTAPPHLEEMLLANFHAEAPGARKLPRWAYAAAVALLITLGLVAYASLRNKTSNHLAVDRTPVPVTPTPQQPHQPEYQPASRSVERKPGERRVAHHRSAATHRNKILIRDGMTLYANANDGEVTTDFLLLNSSGNLAPMERGQLIRVRMPRSALVSFGLPMNADRSEIPVKADLLVGEDGLARAIRFVR